MDDLISRQVLLAEQFASLECILQANKDAGFDVYKRGWNDALQTVYDNAPSAQQWIPCSERLPDKEGEYLVTFNDEWRGPKVRALWYGTPFDIIIDRDKWVFYCDHEYGFETFAPRKPIVAWMPLPEPYKEENNGHD